jgi:hypothetical protein
MRYTLASILLIVITAIASTTAQVQAAGEVYPQANLAIIILPWVRNMAIPGVIFLRTGQSPEETAGALAHENCHIAQMAAGEHLTTPRAELELHCSVVEYFAYEAMGYERGMHKVTHYYIPGLQ